jgi:hypothetical protein
MYFIVDLISAIIWPITILVIVILFRHEFRRSLSRLRSFGYKDLKAEFDRDLSMIGRDLKHHKTGKSTTEVHHKFAGLPKSEDGLLDRLIAISPRAAIVEAWRGIEMTANKVAQDLGMPSKSEFEKNRMFARLVSNGTLPEVFIKAFDKMRHLRAQAVHAEEFALSQSEASQYVKMCRTLQFWLVHAAKKLHR